MASGHTGNVVPGNRLRVRVPCPPLLREAVALRGRRLLFCAVGCLAVALVGCRKSTEHSGAPVDPTRERLMLIGRAYRQFNAERRQPLPGPGSSSRWDSPRRGPRHETNRLPARESPRYRLVPYLEPLPLSRTGWARCPAPDRDARVRQAARGNVIRDQTTNRRPDRSQWPHRIRNGRRQPQYSTSGFQTRACGS